MSDIVEINRIEDLDSYQLVWTALHAETPGASFFNTLEWLRVYWRHFGQDQRLRVLIARSSGRPIGIMPLVVRRESTPLGPVRVLSYPLDHWGSIYQPVGPCQSATFSQAALHVAHTPRDWDLFEPRWVSQEDAQVSRLLTAMQLAGMTCQQADYQTYSVVDCDRLASWEAYLEACSSKTRHEIRRKRRQLERGRRVEHVRYRPEPLSAGGGDPGWDLYDQCLTVAGKSWQAGSRDGNTLCQESVKEFMVDAHQQAARLGMLDLNLLKVDGKPAAYFYGYHTHGVLSGLKMGYDPEGPKGSGAVLLSMLIEDSFQRGVQKIDLGVGDEGFKAKLRTSAPVTQRITHRSPYAWRPGLLEVLRRTRDRLRQARVWTRSASVGVT